MIEDELQLLAEADRRAADYLRQTGERRVFPDAAARAALETFDEPLPAEPSDPLDTLRLLDEAGSPATTASNGPRYFGFVIGATLPAAAAAERLAAAWDQCASSYVNSPAAATIEDVAARWLLEILDLPAESAVGFGTSATACGLSCLTVARRRLLERQGWDFDRDGLAGAPEIRVVIPATVHVTVKKILRILGFGERRLIVAPTDEHGRVDPARLPDLDDRTILCLQAGEVNTGEFDRFEPLIGRASEAGTWVHVDGAFGLWARATESHRHLTGGIEKADSWTTDGHKWLNTPYDGAVAICRDAEAVSEALNADAPYSTAEPTSQKNLTLEFSRRARGLPIWAALRSLGRRGVRDLVERHCRQARRLADGLKAMGVPVLNRVRLNQVLATLERDADVATLLERIQESGRIWFGPSRWNGRAAFRVSVSSWRTTDDDIDTAIEEIRRHLPGRPEPMTDGDLVVTGFDAWPVDLRLTDEFTISKGSLKVAENIFLRLTLASGIAGFGEVAPLPQLFGKDRESSLRALDRLRRRIVGRPVSHYRRLSEDMAAAEPGHPAARAGVETALLDAFCRACRIPMWALWGGGSPAPRETDVTLPILPLDRCLELAEQWWRAGFRTFKLKVGSRIDEDLERLEHLARRHPEAAFIVDANQGYTVDDALRFLTEAERSCRSLLLFEQPVAAADLGGMARVAAATSVPVAADESVMSAGDALEVVRRRAAGVINLKIMRCGVLESIRIAEIAHAAGLGLMIGGMVESRLAMSCSLSLVHGLGWIRHCDLDTPLLLAEDPIRGGYRYDGPRMSVESEPGLGLEPVVQS